jgi:hypothetical protein
MMQKVRRHSSIYGLSCYEMSCTIHLSGAAYAAQDKSFYQYQTSTRHGLILACTRHYLAVPVAHVQDHTQKELRLLISIQFQVLFTPLLRVLFTFPLRYLCTIGHVKILSLRGWSPDLQTRFLGTRLTLNLFVCCAAIVVQAIKDIRGYHPLWQYFPIFFIFAVLVNKMHVVHFTCTLFLSLFDGFVLCCASTKPSNMQKQANNTGYAGPRSLATTCGVSVDLLFLKLFRCFSLLGK